MKLTALALLIGCTPKVPPHLAIDPPAGERTQATEVRDLRSAIEALVRADPLARAPVLPDLGALESFDEGKPNAAYVEQVKQSESGQGQVEREFAQLEDVWTGTAVVALSRGYRLRLIENRLATTPDLDEDTARQIAVLMTPLQDTSANDTLPRGPLEWLDGDGPLPERLRRVGDRWVLAGWLDHPAIPLEPVVASLDSPVYDGLIQSPVGALVRARGSGATADVGTGFDDLAEATRLALLRAAADRDQEQAAWAEERRGAIEQIGADEPIATLLRRAATSLTANASSDDASAGAFLALAALRWEDACSDPPCTGLDRTRWMRTAGTWSERIAPLAATWQTIALKQALDDMDVGHETVLFPKATLTLTDALIGTGAGPLELSLLRRQTPDPQVWLELARAVGTEGATDWEETRVALGRHLEQQAAHALQKTGDSPMQEPLERISRRAIP